MVKLLSLRSRKDKARAKAEKKSSGDSSTSTTLSTNRGDGTDASIETYSSSPCSESQTSNLYMNHVNRSVMEMYAHAQMSTTIAANLPKEEFGSQENFSLYSPNATYSSQIIHPVECKRDIFVESVTPLNLKFKSKNHRGKSRKNSIYHAKVGREQSPYRESSDVHYVPVPLRRGSTFGSDTNATSTLAENGNYNNNNNNNSNNNNRVNTNLPLRRGGSTFGIEDSIADSNSYNGNNTNLPRGTGSTYSSENENKNAITDSTSRHENAPYDEEEHGIDHAENYIEHRTDDPLENAADELSLTYTYSTDEDKENEDKPAKITKPTIAARKQLSINTSSSALLGPNLSINTFSSALLGPNSSNGIVPGMQAAKARRAMGNAKFRPNNTNHLRVDTGPIGYEANEVSRPINQTRLRMGIVDRALKKLHTHDEHEESLFREHPRAAMDVSPSSTVSSLTLPAELEYYTPRDIGHSNSLPMITEDDGNFREI